ncbi:hypothetical protein HWD35_05805 [Tsukamurella tyrosinosolvens]|uniref:hypothetical protein n=1 Tax=Tsukamurella tyrosinosolvens TaxID=57704 RepID=UPI001CE15F78|nr:hypothetical protein [Tsukamurella tyrosinosolvens]MCA4994221.1 hypothetical protein [Tsukamurella tyrosinosolvens]
MTSSSAEILEASERVAEHLLRPNACAIDQGNAIPPGHFAALTDAGLFGVLAADEPLPLIFDVGETLVAACLSTGFVWAQHQGATLRILRAPAAIREEWLPRMLSGEVLAGITYAGLPSHGSSLRARRATNGDLEITGHARFVTSWPWISLLIAWVHEVDSDVAHAVAIPNPRELACSVSALPLIAANASSTVAIEIDSSGWHVPASQIITTIPIDHARTTPLAAARSNATLALGLLTGIATDLSHHDPVAAGTVAATRTRLRRHLDHIVVTSTDISEMTTARATLLAETMNAATTLYRAAGSAATIASSTAARRLREAAFIQTAATTREERALACQQPIGAAATSLQ